MRSIEKGTPNSTRIRPAVASGDIDHRRRVISRSTSESAEGLPWAWDPNRTIRCGLKAVAIRSTNAMMSSALAAVGDFPLVFMTTVLVNQALLFRESAIQATQFVRS